MRLFAFLALFMIVAFSASAQTPQTLNSLSAAAAWTRNNSLPLCQVGAGCGASDSLVRGALSQINTYLSMEQVNCTNTAATDPGLISTALATGRNVHIIGTCNHTTQSSAFQLATPGQVVTGDGMALTVLNVGINVITNGLFQCATPVVFPVNGAGYNQMGPTVKNLRIVHAQVNTASRASLINFTAPLNFQNCYNARIEEVRLEECMVCIDLRGQSGQTVVRRAEISPLSVGIWVDGSAAPVLIDDVQFEPYGAELYGVGNCIDLPNSGLCALFQTSNPAGTPQTTSGTDGPIGIVVGRMDFMDIRGTLFFIGQGMAAVSGSFPGCCVQSSLPHLAISDSGFDSFGGLAVLAGEIRITNTYFGTTGAYGSGTQYGIGMVSGGDANVICAGCRFYTLNTVPIIAINRGTLTMTGSLISSTGDVALQAEDTAQVNIHGLSISGGGGSLGRIYINRSGTGGAIANISGVMPLTTGGGNVLIHVVGDNDHRIIGTGLNGWVNVCPSTQTNMRSVANGTAANATCN